MKTYYIAVAKAKPDNTKLYLSSHAGGSWEDYEKDGQRWKQYEWQAEPMRPIMFDTPQEALERATRWTTTC